MKRRFYSLLALLAMTITACGSDGPDAPTPPSPSEPTETVTTFAHGADISWYTEMEADGRQFYNASGEARSCPVLMKELGMNAVRLRVWVNPENAACNFNNTADVVAKAKAAKAAGLDEMID